MCTNLAGNPQATQVTVRGSEWVGGLFLTVGVTIAGFSSEQDPRNPTTRSQSRESDCKRYYSLFCAQLGILAPSGSS